MQKWKKVIGGCNKNTKETLIDNDYLQPNQATDEFHFMKSNINNNASASNGKHNINKIFPIYNEYDNLQHQTIPKHLIQSSSNKSLKETTNVSNTRGGLLRVFGGQKSTDKNSIQKDEKNKKDNFNYCELYDHNNTKEKLNTKKIKVENQDGNLMFTVQDENNNLFNTDDLYYYSEIPETANLIDQNQIKGSQPDNKRLSDSKMNLFTRFENGDKQPEIQNLTSLRELNTFSNQHEAFHWYLNLINETITNFITVDKQLGEQDVTKRLNICQAHLLYARNFFEMRINKSTQMKAQLADVHPCLIALACLLDSDAVKIVESHNCACDTYIYLFSTRLKFCAWKSKLYIILKKPKRSSIDRLNLIEGLTNCHKLIQEKTS